MKVCLILQRRFALLGHAMACNLKREYPHLEFCALVQTRESMDFLQNQKDFQYTSLLLDEDIHRKLFDEQIDESYLRLFEKEYGIPNLWPFLHIDRVIMHGQLIRDYPHDKPTLSHHQMRQRMQVTAKEITAFLDRERPDVVVGSVVSALSTLLLYKMAQKRGIKTITMDLIRVSNLVSFTEDYKTFTDARDRFKELQAGRKMERERDVVEFLKQFRDKPAPFMVQYNPGLNKRAYRKEQMMFLKPQRLLRSILWHIGAIFRDLGRKKNRDFMDHFIWWAAWDKLKRKIKVLYGFSDLYSEPSFNERYAFFPLHIEPEMAVSLLAPEYTNQLEVIKAAARALPFDMLLYVKEHPGMVGFRPRSYYKELLKIPNVRLIEPGIPGTALTKAAQLTITLTSTAGWESILLKRPVITFGEVYYNDIPGVERCRSFEELPYLIQKQLSEWEHNEDTLIKFVSALLETSVNVDFYDLWTKTESLEKTVADPGLVELSGALAKKIGL